MFIKILPTVYLQHGRYFSHIGQKIIVTATNDTHQYVSISDVVLETKVLVSRRLEDKK